jgi:hypothetical protein
MTYHKVVPQLRRCALCQQEFWAADKRRIYCKSSCNTQAYNRRQAAAQALAGTPATSLAVAAPETAVLPQLLPVAKQTLDWNLNNIALLGTASALGQVGVELGKALLQLFTTRTPPPPVAVAQRPDPLSWLPAGLLTAAAPRVPLELPALGRTLVFVELHYLGHVLYYQPRERWLLWRVVPGTLLALLSAAYVDGVAEQVPYQAPAALPASGATSPGGKADASVWAPGNQATDAEAYPVPQVPPITPSRPLLGQPKFVG